MIKNLINFLKLVSKQSIYKKHCIQHIKVNKSPILTFCRTMTSKHELSLETPIVYLKSEEAFSKLSDSEKKFVHHLSRASWWGGLVCLCQRSPESPVIFNLLTLLFRSQPINDLKEMALSKADFSEDEFKSLLIYFSGFLYNFGNYMGFGDSKFIPSVSQEKLVKLIKISKAYMECPDVIDNYLKCCLDHMYSLADDVKFLGLPPKGVTMYFSPNCTAEDAEMIKEYMISKNFEPWNSRLIKRETNGDIVYDIKLAAVEKSDDTSITVESDVFKGHKIKVSRGDYSFALKHVIDELKLSRNYANEIEKQMIDKYIESYTTGCIKAHKAASTHWVKNKSPAVETYMGFIEVYVDPTNQRAEYESFVAIVNREQSRKLDLLVERAEKEFLPLLPWGTDFEIDTFTKPDFSSLDIVTFASPGLPIGINIPNYKDVQEEVGFKNVSLGNVMAARYLFKGGPFLTDEDHTLREKHGELALEIQVALHELLGHGCGKFLRRKEDGTLNFEPSKVKDPFTGGEIMFYETGKNYQSEFGSIGSAYEECRAENVGLYLALNNDILDLFGVLPEHRDDVVYVIWLDLFYSGLKGLEMYQMQQKKWGQAHCQARFVLLNVALEAGVATIEETVGSDGLPDLHLILHKSKIRTEGKQALGEFLKKLQIYRSMGDSENGTKLLEKYSQVSFQGELPFAKWNEIIFRKRKPRMCLTMPNTQLEGDNVKLVSYENGPEGLISSWVQRFTASQYALIGKCLLEFSQTCHD